MKGAEIYFKKNKNIVFLCRKTNPVNFTIDFLKSLAPKTKVLYISVDKSFSILADKLTNEGIDYSRWFFIDCISSSLMMAESPSKQCLYLTSPKSLVDLAIAIDDHVGDTDVIIFDNISGLLVYNGNVPSLQLLNTLMSKIRHTHIKAVYLLAHDTNKEVMEDLSLFADKLEIV